MTNLKAVLWIAGAVGGVAYLLEALNLFSIKSVLAKKA